MRLLMAVGAVYKMDTCSQCAWTVTISLQTMALMRLALQVTDEQCCACRDYPVVLPVLLMTAAHMV